MILSREHAIAGECCVDCLFWLANGDKPDHMSEAEIAAWLADIARLTAGCEVTLGMFAEDHACATNFTVTYAPTRYSRRRLTVEVRADDIADARYRAEWKIPAGARIVGYPHRHDLMTESHRGGECECEQTTFSRSPCDVCGSYLAGSRDAVVFWMQPDGSSGQPKTPAEAAPASVPETASVPEPADPDLDWHAWAEAIADQTGYR